MRSQLDNLVKIKPGGRQNQSGCLLETAPQHRIPCREDSFSIPSSRRHRVQGGCLSPPTRGLITELLRPLQRQWKMKSHFTRGSTLREGSSWFEFWTPKRNLAKGGPVPTSRPQRWQPSPPRPTWAACKSCLHPAKCQILSIWVCGFLREGQDTGPVLEVSAV